MKKFFASAFVVLSMFAFVACESNPAIKAAKDFLDESTVDNLMKIQDMEEQMTAEEVDEYKSWANKHKDEIMEAIKSIDF